MLNEQGGVIDDLIVYFLSEDFFRVVVNAATHDKDLAWIKKQAEAFGVKVTERADLSMIAVQGPNARAKVQSLLSEATREKAAKIGKFVAVEGDGLFIARTGYTGEDGYEIIVPEAQAVGFVEQADRRGRRAGRSRRARYVASRSRHESVRPGHGRIDHALGSRAGVDGRAGRGPRLHRSRRAGKTEGRAACRARMVGLVMDEKGVLRHGQRVVTAQGDGEILSGTFSPTLGKAIAFARVPAGTVGNAEVDIRGKLVPVRVVKYPFVRDGKPCQI